MYQRLSISVALTIIIQGLCFFFFFQSVSSGSGPPGDRHNRRRETDREPSGAAGGHRRVGEEVQTGALLRATLRHRGRGQGVRGGRHAGEVPLVLSVWVDRCHQTLALTLRRRVCVPGEHRRPGTRSEPGRLPSSWRSRGRTQTAALDGWIAFYLIIFFCPFL